MFKKPWVRTLYSSNTVSIFLTLPPHCAILTILVAVDEQLAKHQHNRVVVSHQYVDESQICHEGWKIALKKDDIMKTLSEWNSKQTKNIHKHTKKNRKKNASLCFVFVCLFIFLVFYYIRRVRRLMIIISLKLLLSLDLLNSNQSSWLTSKQIDRDSSRPISNVYNLSPPLPFCFHTFVPSLESLHQRRSVDSRDEDHS